MYKISKSDQEKANELINLCQSAMIQMTYSENISSLIEFKHYIACAKELNKNLLKSDHVLKIRLSAFIYESVYLLNYGEYSADVHNFDFLFDEIEGVLLSFNLDENKTNKTIKLIEKQILEYRRSYFFLDICTKLVFDLIDECEEVNPISKYYDFINWIANGIEKEMLK